MNFGACLQQTMLNFQKLSLLILLTLVFQPVNVIGKNHYCMQKCGRVHIQFPFYLRNSKLNHTAEYPPGFDLLCTENKKTLILELPNVPTKLAVRKIDYKSQQIQIYDPANCLPSQLLQLSSASISPFQFPSYDYAFKTRRNFSFFRCDSMSSSCPILLLSSYLDVIRFPEILSCTKVKDVLSANWMDQYSLYDPTVTIEWSKPDCKHCETQNQKCKWKNSTKVETECFVCSTNTTPTSTIVLIAAGMECPLILPHLSSTSVVVNL